MPLPENPPMCIRWEIRHPTREYSSMGRVSVYAPPEGATGRYAFATREAVVEFFMRYGGGEDMGWGGDIRGLVHAVFPDFIVREIQEHIDHARFHPTITVELAEIRRPTADEARILGLDQPQPQAAQSRALDDYMLRDMSRRGETFPRPGTWGSPQGPDRARDPNPPVPSSAEPLAPVVPPQPQPRRRAIRV